MLIQLSIWHEPKWWVEWCFTLYSHFVVWRDLHLFLQKRMRVKKLPMILALHLKRFKYMEQYNRHIKVSHRVVFPLELRLFNTVSWKMWAYFNHWLRPIYHRHVPFSIQNWKKNCYLAVWRCCQPRQTVWPGCRRDPLWQWTKQRPLHKHCKESWVLAPVWWWHGWCKSDHLLSFIQRF